MNHDQPLYGELVIPFNAENQTQSHEAIARKAEELRLMIGHEAIARKAEELRLMIEKVAYHLAEKRGFIPGHELDDWLDAEIRVLSSLK